MNRESEEVLLLRRARRYLRAGYGKGLCTALRRAYEYDCSESQRRAYNALSSRVSKSIAGYTFAEGWLHNIHGVPAEQLTYKNMREYRLRWVNALIKEYSQ